MLQQGMVRFHLAMMGAGIATEKAGAITQMMRPKPGQSGAEIQAGCRQGLEKEPGCVDVPPGVWMCHHGRWATERLVFLRRSNSLKWAAAMAPSYSPLGPGGLGFLAAPPVLHCPGRETARGTDESSTQRAHGFHWNAGRETEARGQKGMC